MSPVFLALSGVSLQCSDLSQSDSATLLLQAG